MESENNLIKNIKLPKSIGYNKGGFALDFWIEVKEEDLGKARDRLNWALEILETQPPDEDSVKRLRRQVATLLSDVARASPF